MGRLRGDVPGEVIVLGPTSTRMLTPDEVVERVENMFPTEEGGYRSITGKKKFNQGDTSSSGASYGAQAFGKTKGIHHALLGENGEREVILCHNDDELWEFRGWDQQWYPLIGPGTTTQAQLRWRAPEDADDRFPTQFVTTPNGIIVIPSQGRAYFYDGEVVAPLGFVRPPGPPTALGPKSSRDTLNSSGSYISLNDLGYAHSRLWGTNGAMDDAFGYGRIGTVVDLDYVELNAANNTPVIDSNTQVAGILLEGELRYRYAWVDRWGNISELSPPSNQVKWDRQTAIQVQDATGGYDFCAGKNARFQLAVSGISKGPPHVQGKAVYRQKDTLNSGDVGFYFLTNDAVATTSSFATIPSREGEFYPDNIPDSWLISRAPETTSCPIHKMGCLAMGRYWAGNLLANPGAIRPSFVGMYGTFQANSDITVDPSGAEILGMHAYGGGMLVWTRTSTFLVSPNDAGDGFVVKTLARSIGCVAPSSVATMRDGTVVWLGRDGFYMLPPGGMPQFAFDEHRDEVLAFNRSHLTKSHAIYNPESGFYECWVPTGSSTSPNKRYKFNGQFWHWDPYDGTFLVYDSCVVDNLEPYVLSCGTFNGANQVAALDRGHDVQEAKIKTGWISGLGGPERTSVREVRLWLRETGARSSDASKIKIQVRRNWRAEVQSTVYIDPYPDIATNAAGHPWRNAPTDIEKNPDTWGTGSIYATSSYYMRRRRPFWARRTIDVPTCEAFQLEISSTSGVEVLGFQFVFQPRDESLAGARR